MLALSNSLIAPFLLTVSFRLSITCRFAYNNFVLSHWRTLYGDFLPARAKIVWAWILRNISRLTGVCRSFSRKGIDKYNDVHRALLALAPQLSHLEWMDFAHLRG